MCRWRSLGIVGYGLMFAAAALGRWLVLLQLAEIGFAAACFLELSGGLS